MEWGEVLAGVLIGGVGIWHGMGRCERARGGLEEHDERTYISMLESPMK